MPSITLTLTQEQEERFDDMVFDFVNSKTKLTRYEYFKQHLSNELAIQKQELEQQFIQKQAMTQAMCKQRLLAQRAELVGEIEKLIQDNEKQGWKAAYKSGSDAGAGYTIGYKAALQDVLTLLEKGKYAK